MPNPFAIFWDRCNGRLHTEATPAVVQRIHPFERFEDVVDREVSERDDTRMEGVGASLAPTRLATLWNGAEQWRLCKSANQGITPELLWQSLCRQSVRIDIYLGGCRTLERNIDADAIRPFSGGRGHFMLRSRGRRALAEPCSSLTRNWCGMSQAA